MQPTRKAAPLRSEQATDPERADTVGLFGPSSAAWTVSRERVLLLGGPRALLLQLAHPLVAAGVADHSDFESDPLGRLRRTLDVTLGMVFGERARAEGFARRLGQVHAGVVGVLREATAVFPAGTPYRALDPELLLWVHATLIDSTFVCYRRLIGPLPLRLRQRYYEESKILAGLFGIPPTTVPPDLRRFRGYVRSMLAGTVLEPTPTARRLARAVLRPPRPLWLRGGAPLGSLVGAGMLPPRLRRAYGLRWGARERQAWRVLQATLRSTLPWTPAPLRLWADARRAEARLARHR